MDDRPTPAQERVLDAIRSRIEQGEPAPTYRELCKELRWSSTGTVRDHLQALARKGYVELSGRGHRQIRLLRDRVSVSRVPVVGRVVAGSPVAAEQHNDGFLPVPGEWTVNGSYFAVRVTGSSMEGAGILDGDFVIARQQPVAADGDVVVATIEGETTLKRFKRTNAGVTLAAENPRHRSISVRTEEASVQGVVVGLLRTYGQASAVRPISAGATLEVAASSTRRRT